MVRATYVRFYLFRVLEIGGALPALLKDTDIDYQRINDSDYTIDLLQLKQLISNIIALDIDDTMSFQLGRGFSLKQLGLIGHALASCETMLSVCTFWNHFNALIGNAINFPVSLDEEQCTIEFVEACPLDEALPFCIEQSMSSTLALFEELTGKPVRFQHIELSYPQPQSPEQLHAYQDHFQCPVRFNCARNMVYFDKADLQRPIVNADRETYLVFNQHCKHVLAELEASEGLGKRIRQIFISRSRQPPKMNELAKHLGYSERNLRRKLSEEELSYKQLLNDFRRDLSIQYLKSTSLSAKEIAYLVGFDDITSYRRAFKAWTGKTVNQYRTELPQNESLYQR